MTNIHEGGEVAMPIVGGSSCAFGIVCTRSRHGDGRSMDVEERSRAARPVGC